jgi:hypothetical protein
MLWPMGVRLMPFLILCFIRHRLGPRVIVGLDEILVARWLARFVVNSAWIGSFKFFHELS